jgi:hypothetical protein
VHTSEGERFRIHAPGADRDAAAFRLFDADLAGYILLDSMRSRRSAVIDRSFLLQRVQPGLSGIIDRSLSTLAPIFAVVLATHRPLTAFFSGPAPSPGSGRWWAACSTRCRS